MITLGIETSCDETALALIETRTNNGLFECRIIASLVHSQASLHSAYGGVFPSLAKREHGKYLIPLLRQLLTESEVSLINARRAGAGKPSIGPDSKTDNSNVISEEKFSISIQDFSKEYSSQNPDLTQSFNTDVSFLANIPAIDRIAVTEGPGLEPALWVGISFAELLSKLWSIPLIPVNHMEGHIVGSLLGSDHAHGDWQSLKSIEFPAIALLISGGHTELVKIDRVHTTETFPLKYSVVGQTKDDAVGEAFDKVARLLELPYPGGPEISKLAKMAREENIISEIKLPRPMLNSGDLNFSFSGLKTSVLYAVKNYLKENKLNDRFKKGLAREFEDAVKESLDHKLRRAIDEFNIKTVIIGGGVSANQTLRNAFENTATEYGIPIYLPSSHVSGDNALMIALAGAIDEKTYTNKLKAQGTKRL